MQLMEGYLKIGSILKDKYDVNMDIWIDLGSYRRLEKLTVGNFTKVREKYKGRFLQCISDYRIADGLWYTPQEIAEWHARGAVGYKIWVGVSALSDVPGNEPTFAKMEELGFLGAVNFFEIANTHLYKTDVWYRLMNCGYVVAPAAGTDLPNDPFRDVWQPLLGEVRMYVHTDGKVDFEWFKRAVREGKVFISGGPMIQITVDGIGPGGMVRLPDGGGEVLVTAELSGPRPLEAFDVLCNRKPLMSEIQKKDGSIHRWQIAQRVRITQSSWLAARGEGIAKRTLEQHTGIRQNTIAHTGAVRVLVAEARPVPKQDIALVAAPIEVDKQMAAERVLAHHVICEHRELVESVTHIRRLRIDEDSYGGGKRQHKPAWRKTERTWLKVSLSAEERIRNVWPEENRSSMGMGSFWGMATSMKADGLEWVGFVCCDGRPESLLRQL